MSPRCWQWVALVALVAVTVTACAAGPNAGVGSGDQSGFLMGLWHGAITPVTFVVSLFDDHVAIYEVHDTGHWYDFGFLLGASVTFSGAARSGSAGGSSRGHRNRRRRSG